MNDPIRIKGALLFVYTIFICCNTYNLTASTAPGVEKEKELVLEKRYLNLPVQNGVPKQKLSLLVDGDTLYEFFAHLAVDKPDYWVFMDISMLKGKKALLSAEKLPDDSRGFDMIYQDDSLKEEDTIYKEKLRPQFHYTAKRGWIQDPVGLVYYDSEYHMFPLHYPFGWDEGHKGWGHAVSKDLIHWKELPMAIYPYQSSSIYSGSAVIDKNNTSGFQTGKEKVMVAAHSLSDKQVQCLAYSNDRGRTWTNYSGNPIIGDRRALIGNEDIRDPKIFWHEPTKKWVMVLFEGIGNSIFTSDNLKDWEHQSHIEDSWECPELFELPVDGDPENTKWVMYGAAGVYMIGDFDGKKFTMESGKHYYSTGKLNSDFKHKGIFYASQTYNDEPKGRRIQLGWGIVFFPDMPFNQMITFPAELSLRTTSEGIRMYANPIKEVELLHKKEHVLTNIRLQDDPKDLLAELGGDLGELLHIKAEFEMGPRKSYGVFGLRINGFEIEYDARHNRLNDAFLNFEDGKIYMEILIDRTSVEIYANHGRLYLADAHFSVNHPKQFELYHLWGGVHLSKLQIYELNSIWD
ncbi:MAG: GH32 C-terminal domain-containing protein [Planctomycetota bacterium]|jgi:sucrose-6-phosphate hydrolase SacC (GH32 family)